MTPLLAPLLSAILLAQSPAALLADRVAVDKRVKSADGAAPGSLAGRVIDRQGKPVPNVKAFHSGDGPAQTAVTDADGRFRLNGIPAGTVFVFCGVMDSGSMVSC